MKKKAWISYKEWITLRSLRKLNNLTQQEQEELLKGLEGEDKILEFEYEIPDKDDIINS